MLPSRLRQKISPYPTRLLYRRTDISKNVIFDDLSLIASMRFGWIAVGAGSVVTRDIASYAIVGNVQAKHIADVVPSLTQSGRDDGAVMKTSC